jgi:hypothetical protein
LLKLSKDPKTLLQEEFSLQPDPIPTND